MSTEFGRREDVVRDQPLDFGPAPVPEVTAYEADVLAQIEAQVVEKSSWSNFFLLLVGSAVAFGVLGRNDWTWETTLALLLAVGFHELGHYIPMRIFGYRNLKMFFIPFVGGAVSGRHFNVEGWKKAFVALMGPFPGLVVATVCLAVAVFTGSTLAFRAGVVLAVLNAFNLLPVYTFDGGRALHAVLFCRHPIADVGFQATAALGMSGLALLTEGFVSYLWFGMAASSLLSLGSAWRVAHAARRLREAGFVASPEQDTIPMPQALAILHELQPESETPRPPNFAAIEVVRVYETLNAHPPGPFGTVMMLGLYAAAIGLSAVCVVLAAFAFVMDDGENDPLLPFEGGVEQVAVSPEKRRETLAFAAARFQDAEAAAKAFRTESLEVPPGGAVSQIGNIVLVDGFLDEDLAKQRSKRLAATGAGWARICDGVVASVTLADEAAAERLVAELDAFDAASDYGGSRLTPPWSPEWAKLPADRRTRFEVARRTADLAKKAMQSARAQAPLNPKDLALDDRVHVARDLATLDARFKRTPEAGEEPWDPQVVAAIRAELVAHRDAKDAVNVNALDAKFGELFGASLTDRTGGFVTQADKTGNTVKLRVTHDSPADGVPPMLRWLATKGTVEYRFQRIPLVKPAD